MTATNLTREQARERSDLLQVDSYDVRLDLTTGSADRPGETFRSETTVEFRARRDQASTFIDIDADTIRAVTLNGVEITAPPSADGRIGLTVRAGENTLVVDAWMSYTNTCEGLHRFVDPVDGETYVYSQFEVADAKRVFACFDQPDLKAAFSIQATVPEHWETISGGAVERSQPHSAAKTVDFVTTPRMSPYVTALIAGPYRAIRARHDGIELGVWCRASLAGALDGEELLEVTAQGLDWLHAKFGVRYPFGDKYDQVFVPEFNGGAMENVGAVTFSEDHVFRSKVTAARHERRAETLLHEMAHMWFGNLVTMRWWDDLWLKESFVTYVAMLCQTEATRWGDGWTTFACTEKARAYRQDGMPTTHPVATDAPDVRTTESNFDGITYIKGAAVLKQLATYIGVDTFEAGMRDYFERYAFDCATVSDLLSVLERASGRSLTEWSSAWLDTAGVSTLAAESVVDADGRYTAVDITQSAPTTFAASNRLRTHRLAVGLYDYDGVELVRRRRLELEVTGARTPVPALVGERVPALLLVNDDDLTYCKVGFDTTSLSTLQAGGLGALSASLPRAICWSALWETTRDGELATRDFLALVCAAAPSERVIGVLETVLGQALLALDRYADPAWVATGCAMLADTARAALVVAEPGSDHQLAWARALLRSGHGDQDDELWHGLLAGDQRIDGLVVEGELRWAVVEELSARGTLEPAVIDAELAADPSAAGQRHAATARASQPSADAKAQAWQRAIGDRSLPNATRDAIAAGFARRGQDELVRPYRDRYFAEVVDACEGSSPKTVRSIATGLFPLWRAGIDEQTVASADRLLAHGGLPSTLRRPLAEGRAEVVRAIRAQEVDAAAAFRSDAPGELEE